MNKIINGDCLEVMKDIPDGSIDAIITDPPYGTTQCKWDSIIDLEEMWKQLHRIIKPNGAIVLFGSEPFSSLLRMSNIKNFKYDWVWKKDNASNFFAAKFQPLNNIEDIMVFGFGGCNNGAKNPLRYNPQGVKKINKLVKNGKSVGGAVGKAHQTTMVAGREYTQTLTNYPKKILEFKRDKGLHPTQKPVALFEYLIKTYTDIGDTVLDFTSGSGTTAIAALNTGRNFICIEKNTIYYRESVERIRSYFKLPISKRRG